MMRRIGAGVLASAVSMDKAYMKIVLRDAGLPVMPSVTITRRDWERDPAGCAGRAAALGYPLFVKPARGGSSIGISIVTVVLTRNVQINHAELGAAMTPFNQNLAAAMPSAVAGDPTALMKLDGLVNLQALMVSYVNDFKLMMIVTLCALPLVFLLRKPAPVQAVGGSPAAHMD